MFKLLFTIFFSLTTLFASMEDGEPLSAEEAFKVDINKDLENININFTLGEGIYLYDDKVKSFINGKDISNLIKKRKPILKEDFLVHKKDLNVTIPLNKIDEKNKFNLLVEYQGCSEMGICYPKLSLEKEIKLNQNPFIQVQKAEQVLNKNIGMVGLIEKSNSVNLNNNTQKIDTKKVIKEIEVKKNKNSNTKEELSETDFITQTLTDQSFFWVVVSFFGFGVLLSLTPCIFPMIPILSGIIVSKSQQGKLSPSKGFFISFVYVLSMSIAYTIAGVIAGLFGMNIQSALQNPIVISIFAFIFVLLALSLFGYFEIRLPSKFQNKVEEINSENNNKNGIGGIAIMGFLSALIVGPCVAPPLAAALVYIGQTGDAILGGVSLFVMSLGMGLPLLVIGLGAGKFMPKPGGWMTEVSKIFGIFMLIIAAWMLDRIIPNHLTLVLFGLILLGTGAYYGSKQTDLSKIIKYLFISLGLVYVIGGFMGNTNFSKPLEIKGISSNTQSKELSWTYIKSLDELEKFVTMSNKKVIVDFTAKWCVSCKEMEEITFKDEKVMNKMISDFNLVKIDITDETPQLKEIMKKFNVIGPPAFLFFENGQEVKHKRVIGYQEPNIFIEKLN
jgi:thiol:disulfide interchange protein DsbD